MHDYKIRWLQNVWQSASWISGVTEVQARADSINSTWYHKRTDQILSGVSLENSPKVLWRIVILKFNTNWFVRDILTYTEPGLNFILPYNYYSKCCQHGCIPENIVNKISSNLYGDKQHFFL